MKNGGQRGDNDRHNPPQGLSLFFNSLILNNKHCETFCTAPHFLCQEANLARSLTGCAQVYPQSLGISGWRPNSVDSLE
jgi:hypothetical protein